VVASPVRRTSLSPNQRAWGRFRRNRLGFVSLIVFAAMLLVGTFAELVSNDSRCSRASTARVRSLHQQSAETRFGGDFKSPTDWHDPFIREQFAKPGQLSPCSPSTSTRATR
jgi:microcin C transport system permease protein